MNRRLFLALVFSALALRPPAASAAEFARAAPAGVGLSAERLERIGAVINKHIAEKKIAGAVTLVARQGFIAHLGTYGMADAEAQQPMREDTIFRIASMTKPITSLAVMMLYEEGHFLLTDPVADYLPSFKEMKVLTGDGSTVPAEDPITIRQLLTHTSGLAYQWNERVGGKYHEAGITHGLIHDPATLAGKMPKLAQIPLVHHPGEAFHYGLSTDVLGYLVEKVSGKPLDEFFRERIFKPLGMNDTGFMVPEEKRERLAAVYQRGEGEEIRRAPDGEITEQETLVYTVTYPVEEPKTYFSGGGGLVSTITDYARFAQLMLDGGELEGARLLSPKSVELMTIDHIGDRPGIDASGFGLGFSVVRGGHDLVELGSAGAFGWGGFFYTTFFVDPAEDMIGIFMAQLHPAGGLRLADQFKVLAYQSIVE